MTATTSGAAVGMGVPRVEGPDKVTGRAKYAVDFAVGEVAYVWPVSSTVAKGTIRSVDTTEAGACPGVLAVLGPANAPHLRPVGDRALLIFQSNDVHHRGQFVAAVVADTLETARTAAGQIRIDYAEAAHECELTARHASRRRPEVAGDGLKPTRTAVTSAARSRPRGSGSTKRTRRRRCSPTRWSRMPRRLSGKAIS